MSQDLVDLGGYLLAFFVSGYAAGFLIYSMKRFFDQV